MKWSGAKTELKKLRKNLGKQSPLVKWGVGLLSVIAVVALAYLVFSLAYLGKVYPRVVVGGVSFGGLTLNQVEEKLSKLIESSSQKITLKYGDESQTLEQKEIDWSYDVAETAKDIFVVGRDPNSKLNGLKEQLLSVVKKHSIEPIVAYDDQALSSTVDTFAAAVDEPAVDASAEYQNDDLTITKERTGKIIDRDEVAKQVVKNWRSFLASEINVQTHTDLPKVVLGDPQKLEKSAEKLSQQNLTVNWPGKSRVLKAREVKKLIGFVGVAQATDSATQQKVLAADFTVERSKIYLESLSEIVNRPAEEPKLVIRNGKLVITDGAKEGEVIDLTASSNSIVKAMRENSQSSVVELTLRSEKPVITEASLDALGIVERIGYGETNFVGSPNNRKHNISNGVQILQSALLKPGEEFSTVATLGAVDKTTGYLPELVIKENRTIPEYGGGLCQVSTTLFRSVLDAGLKVTERRNHSYRVSYYEPPVGLDATIYLPKPDFRFVNDTSNHILVQGRIVGTKVIFELWGTRDGRVASVSTPQILSTTAPGEPIYADTDTLPLGEEKQIEKPHEGAVTVAYYTVKRNGETINQQTFRSVYKAWPARFLVGTNPDLPPSDPPPDA